ncbi:MAG: hypothetical protein BWY72_01132 [Bacteroidetes bacterium ADurb.Bin416]|nr:MAG: hypothetical protein BWY72_01132 [Bacteroidetes bacterium ADurb.Bin416]
MIHHPFVTDDGRFVGKLVVVGFRRENQRFARPVCPVDQVVGTAESVEGIVDDPGSESRKVKHHPKVAHTLHHGITGDAAFVVEDWIARVACPAFHVVRQGYSYPLPLDLGGGIHPPGVVEHNKGFSQGLRAVPEHTALVEGQVFPPPPVFVRGCQDGLGRCLPRMSLHHQLFGAGQAYFEHPLFVSLGIAPNVRHPIPVFIRLNAILTPPGRIDQSRITAPLVGIPTLVRERQHASQRGPMQEVVAFGQPGFIAPAVLAPFAVVDQVGHVPAVALPEYGGTIHLVLVVSRSHDQAEFMRCADRLVHGLHTLLRHRSGLDGSGLVTAG